MYKALPYIAGTAVLALGIAIDLQPEVLAWVDHKVHTGDILEGIAAMQAYIAGPPLAAYLTSSVTKALCKGGLEQRI